MQRNLKKIISFYRLLIRVHSLKAADILGLSRSMVSVDIKQLEGQLNVSLLTRNTRNIALTEVGKIFMTTLNVFKIK